MWGIPVKLIGFVRFPRARQGDPASVAALMLTVKDTQSTHRLFQISLKKHFIFWNRCSRVSVISIAQIIGDRKLRLRDKPDRLPHTI